MHNLFSPLVLLGICTLCIGCSQTWPLQSTVNVAVTPTPKPIHHYQKYTGTETWPVTLAPGVQVTKTQLMKGVDKNTMLIIVRNRTGRTVNKYAQIGIESKKRPGFYGLGGLINGGQLVVKERNAAPGIVRLAWIRYDGRATHYRLGASSRVQEGGLPLVFTIHPNDTVTVGRTFKND